MRRRRGGGGGVAVGWPWLWLAVLMVAQGATTADPQAGDLSTSTTAEPTTTEEDMTGRGNKKFGDKCGETKECGFRGSVCDPYKHSCQCRPELTATNHIDKCGEEVSINGSCFFTEQCENKVPQTECKDGRCVCRFEMTPTYKDNKVECTSPESKSSWNYFNTKLSLGDLIVPRQSTRNVTDSLDNTVHNYTITHYNTTEARIGQEHLEKEKLKPKMNKTDEIKKNDEDVGFFNSLLPHVKTLDPRKKMMFRMRVQELLFCMAYSQEHEPSCANRPATLVMPPLVQS